MSKRKDKVEVVSEIEKRIAYHKEKISKLELKKEAVLNPPPRKKRVSMQSVISQAKANGMTIEQVAKKLGIGIEEN